MAVIYLEVTVRLSPLIPWREVMIAEMGSIGFEGFEESVSERIICVDTNMVSTLLAGKVISIFISF